MTPPQDKFSLAQWRRTVATLYQTVRTAPPADRERATADFRTARDELFATHLDSPLTPAQRDTFSGLPYYPYDPDWRVLGDIVLDPAGPMLELDLGDDGLALFTRVARVRFTLAGSEKELAVYWLAGYGGGLWLPFRDGTGGQTTYAGGRYLFDTVKGADLGMEHRRLVLDFNYAYNPSCAYNDDWACPLPPPENWLSLPVPAGEKAFR